MIIRVAGRIFKAIHLAAPQDTRCGTCSFGWEETSPLDRVSKDYGCEVKKREQINFCGDNNGHGYTWREVPK